MSSPAQKFANALTDLRSEMTLRGGPNEKFVDVLRRDKELQFKAAKTFALGEDMCTKFQAMLTNHGKAAIIKPKL